MLKGHPRVRLAMPSSPSSIQCSQHGLIFLSHKNLGPGPENLAQLRLPSGELSEAAETGGTRFSLEEKESNVSFLNYLGSIHELPNTSVPRCFIVLPSYCIFISRKLDPLPPSTVMTSFTTEVWIQTHNISEVCL